MLEPDALREPAAQGGLEAVAGERPPALGLIGERQEGGQAGEAEVGEQAVVVAGVVALRGEHAAVLGERVEQRALLALGEQVLARGGAQDVGEERGPVAGHLVRPRLLGRVGAAERVVADPVEGDLGRLVEVVRCCRWRRSSRAAGRGSGASAGSGGSARRRADRCASRSAPGSSVGFGPKTVKRRSRAASIRAGLTVGSAMLVSDGHGAAASAAAPRSESQRSSGPESPPAAPETASRTPASRVAAST